MKAMNTAPREEEIEVLLLESLASGEPIEATKEYWEEKKRRLTSRSVWIKEQ